MDSKSADDRMTSQVKWPIVLWLSGFLDQPEREAVLGDLTEDSENGGGAIVQVLGLVVRRRAAVLLDLRLWLAVTLVILPVSYLLCAIAQTTAGEGAVYSWMYLNNWDGALTRTPGFWYVLREIAVSFGSTCFALACWSWSAGFLIGRLPDAILRASRNTFIALLVAAFQVNDGPGRFIYFLIFWHGLPVRTSLPDYNFPVTGSAFYRVFFPWIALVILVILPALSGIRQADRTLLNGWKMRAILVTAAAGSLLIMLIHVPGFGLLLVAPLKDWLWSHRRAVHVLPVLSCWPMFYFIASRFTRHGRHKAVMAQ